MAGWLQKRKIAENGKSIKFQEDLPKSETYSYDSQLKKLFIIHTCFEASKDGLIDLLTKGHKNISVFFLRQDLFNKGAYA